MAKNPYADADEVFPTRDQAFIGGGTTDGVHMPPFEKQPGASVPIQQPPDDGKSVG